MSEEIKDVQNTQEAPETKVPTEQTADTSTPEEKVITMTQAELDAMFKDRIAREKRNAEKAVEQAKAEADKKRLEEAQEYKTLYEQEKAAREQAEAEREAERINNIKQQLVAAAGYSGRLATRVSDLVGATDEEAIKAELDEIKKDIPPVAFADPASTATGHRQQPSQKTATDYGRELFQNRRKK